MSGRVSRREKSSSGANAAFVKALAAQTIAKVTSVEAR
jgi:hypothetical protein